MPDFFEFIDEVNCDRLRFVPKYVGVNIESIHKIKLERRFKRHQFSGLEAEMVSRETPCVRFNPSNAQDSLRSVALIGV